MTQCLIQMTQFCLLFICTFPHSQFQLFLLQASHPSLRKSSYCFCFSFSLLPLKVTLGSCTSSFLVFKCLHLMSSPIWPLALSFLKTQTSFVFSACSSLLDFLPIWYPQISDTDLLPKFRLCSHTPNCLCLLRSMPSMMLGQVERSCGTSSRP